MMHTYRIAVGLTIAFAACGRESPRTPRPADEIAVEAATTIPPEAARDRFVRSGLVPIGKTRAEIVGTLGEPDSSIVHTLPNRHVPGATDSIYTLHYSDLAAIVHVAGGRDLLVSIAVTSNRWLRDPIVQIGAPWEDVRRRLGEPRERTSDGFVYHCPDCYVVPQPVYLIVCDGVIEAVEFTYYVD